MAAACCMRNRLSNTIPIFMVIKVNGTQSFNTLIQKNKQGHAKLSLLVLVFSWDLSKVRKTESYNNLTLVTKVQKSLWGLAVHTGAPTLLTVQPPQCHPHCCCSGQIPQCPVSLQELPGGWKVDPYQLPSDGFD